MDADSTLPMTGDMVLLAKVAEAGSISGAARMIGLERTTVSRRLARLESRLGTDLLNRSNREVKLTEAGRLYYQYCLRVVEAVEDGMAQMTNLDVTVDQAVIVELAVPDAGRFVAAFENQRRISSSGAAIEYKIADSSSGTRDEECDIAIQLGESGDSNEVTIHLGKIPQSIWISPECPDYRGPECSIDDLSGVPCIYTTEHNKASQWRLSRGPERKYVSVLSRFRASDLEQSRDLCVEGSGMAILPDYMCDGPVKVGALERIIPDWSVAKTAVSAVHIKSKYLHRNARSFIEHLRTTA